MSEAVAEGQKLELGGIYTVIRSLLPWLVIMIPKTLLSSYLLHACLCFKHTNELPDLILSRTF